jgi:opacity protein-like surface antigen
MIRRIVVGILFIFSTVAVKAQLYEGAFHVGWNTLKPVSDKEFIDKASSSGVRVGYSRFKNDRFGFGLEGSYNTLDDYVPRQTYEFPGGAITTDIYNYLYYFTLMGNAQYYFTQGNKFIPYASLGMGVAFSEYRIFYNMYQDTDSQTSFVVRPEIGTLFRIKEYSNWGFKTSLSYDYAANKSDYFEIDNFSGLSLQLGFVLFTD